jgi:hypothetical protein
MNGGEDPQNTNHHHHSHQNTNHHNHGDHGDDDDDDDEEEECVNGGCRVMNTILQSIATSSSLSRPITVTMSVSSASPNPNPNPKSFSLLYTAMLPSPQSLLHHPTLGSIGVNPKLSLLSISILNHAKL